MKIKHILKEDIDYESIVNNKYFRQHIMPNINKDMEQGIDNFKELRDNNTERHKDRRLIFTLAEEVFRESKNIIFHGSPHGHYETGKRYELTHRSGPRDSKEIVHNAVNDVAEDLLGENIRNLMFITKKIQTASDYADKYSEIYIVLPIDKPTFYFSEVYEDFFVDYVHEGDALNELNDNVKNTLSFLVSDHESEIKSIVADSDIDTWEFFKIVEYSIKQQTQSDQRFILKYVRSFKFLENSIDKLVEQISDYLLFMLKKKDLTISSSQVDTLDKIVKEILSNYIKNMETAIMQFAKDYVKTVKKSDNINEAGRDYEIMMDCDYFTVVTINDFIKIVEYIVEKKA